MFSIVLRKVRFSILAEQILGFVIILSSLMVSTGSNLKYSGDSTFVAI